MGSSVSATGRVKSLARMRTELLLCLSIDRLTVHDQHDSDRLHTRENRSTPGPETTLAY